ncbi:MAG TPA: nucleoside phosphorylase [Saprospiraceae bacterium]|nr:nucleoside phosphorylase [Saprospiraceae bacterium]HMP14013.1 nucleoside phosphorylase [Saprospiraceae bacterium]
MQPIPDSELVLNADGSIYHLGLQPAQIADTILTVGDPSRVARISKYFDAIEHQVSRREFVTHTGRLGALQLTVISTGIGTDNIDIVVNELDALANIDLNTRIPRTSPRALRIIRVGTSGAVWREAEVGTLVTSAYGVGLDNLMHFYHTEPDRQERMLAEQFTAFPAIPLPTPPYAFAANATLLEQMTLDLQGITLTAPGFYAPQGRQLRGRTRLTPELLAQLSDFQFDGRRITNFEMETAALYGMARLLGHQAVSCNVILANRLKGQFSGDPAKAVEQLIQRVLECINI